MFSNPDALPERADVIIIGGGMIGLTLSLGLARAGLSVIVAERTPYTTQLDPTFDGRVSAVALGSKRLLDRLGAWNAMLPHAEPILDISVSDGNSPFFLHYDHHEVGAEPFGWIVENRHIRHALVEAVSREERIRVIAPADAEGFTVEEGCVLVRLSNGEIVQSSLLVAADGKQSRVRELSGIGAVGANYDQTAIVCTIAHPKSHHGLAQERFLPAGPFAVLPMQDNRSSLVWVESRENAEYFLKLPDNDLLQEIRERVGEHLGALSLEGPRFSFPLSFAHAKSYVAPRVALIGDAAHAIHPLAGQGVNLGFRDVAVLTELMAEQVRLGLDVGASDALAHYQRWRRFDSFAMLAVTDSLNRLFSTSLVPLKVARGMGLWAVSHVPPVKKFFMRHAMGLTGDVPALMKEVA